MNNYISNGTKLFCLLISASFLLFACDNPVGDDDDHPDAVGFLIEQNNVEILRLENNQYIYNTEDWGPYFREYEDEDGETEILFTLSPDVVDMSSGMTPTVVIRWIDSEGVIFNLPEEEDNGEYRLEFTWVKPADTVNCELEDREGLEADDQIRPANLEQHGSDGSWGFHFRADHAGRDQISWVLFHGDHGDFTSTPMTVVVADDEDHEGIENGQYLHERDRCRVR